MKHGQVIYRLLFAQAVIRFESGRRHRHFQVSDRIGSYPMDATAFPFPLPFPLAFPLAFPFPFAKEK